MNKDWVKFISIPFFFIVCIYVYSPVLIAQDNNDDVEVYLDFRHRGAVNSVITSFYKDDQFFLPISELFSLFKIDHTIKGLTVEGKFSVEQTSYRIDLQNNRIHFGWDSYNITADDYLIKELDLYLRPSLFKEIFGLDFSIDFNNLTLHLNTDKELPVIAQALREQRRSMADGNRYSEEKYELKFDRERPFLDGGFVDYNLSSSLNSEQAVYNFNTNLGLQVYGGDLEGSIFGSYSDKYNNVATNNLRWRYMYRDQPWLTKLTIGQTTTDGFARNAYTGIRLTNEPIEPRRLFDEFEIQGSTIPESEVELYLNNMLVDFQHSDEMGDYRFLTPITYGSSKFDLKIYGPSGEVLERSNRIQVPFTFQPKGVFNYNVNIGQLDNPMIGSSDQNMTVQANGAYGVNNWLTAKAGVEYYEGFHEQLPTFTSTISSRILTHYLVTLEGATNAYYRGILNVIYPNSASINFDYTDFTSGFGIYNPSNDDKRIIASAFYPFNFFGIPFNLRASTFSRFRNSNSSTTLRLDANSRLGKLNLRVGYNDRFTGAPDLFNPTNTAFLETSATYNISRSGNLPSYMRGAFFRGQMRYMPSSSRVESAEVLISQNVFKQGRLQLSYGRNFFGNFNTMRFSLVVDFNKVRSSSTLNNMRGNNNFTQNIRGSVGYDTNYNNLLFTSRDQVGRSGAAIKLFVDNNANNIFDEGDDSISENAVRINRSGSSSISKNGILYFTQMQPYYHYNLEMNKSAIKNPMLVPEMEKFGMITDPNRFKKIEIPFYMSGVIEGTVERQLSENRTGGVAGLKLLLDKIDDDFSKEIRTFSDGSFYAYEVPPGDYEIRIDSTQLVILKSDASPSVRKFEVKATPEGDFVDGLNFLLIPTSLNKKVETENISGNMGLTKTANTGGGLSIQYNIGVDSLQAGKCNYRIQLAAFSTAEAAQSFSHSVSGNSASVFYNNAFKLFAVRTGPFQSLGEAAKYTYKLHADGYSDATVVDQCGIPNINEMGGTVKYELQIAAFSNPNRANIFIENLNKKHELDAYSIQDQYSRLHKVKVGPFTTFAKAQKQKRELISSTNINDLYITKEELPAQVINVDFDYLIQLGEFKTSRSATLYAIRIEEEFNIKSKIVIDEDKSVILVADKKFPKWKEVQRITKQISTNQTFQQPVIHLIEREHE